ncbi:MAG: LLM class flavin-dependent oxidoreductase [Dehalococcoidia bacterium]|nr:LLM class flavin-dependent oxidoreductase [Dehalococcoidia bacterium]
MAQTGPTFGSFVIPESDFWAIPELAREAEELGYARIGTGERVMAGNPPRPTVLNIPAMAAAAGATRHIRLLTGIVLIPFYHPVLLAKLVASLDHVSGGRLDFGVGVGGPREATRMEYDVLGVPFEERGRLGNEILRLLKRLWTEENVTFEGRYYQCRDVTLLPFPIQKPHPPIWVAGREEPSIRRAARHGDGWYPYLYTTQRLRESVERIRDVAAEGGRDLSGFHWGLLQPICVADTREEALRTATAIVGERYATPQRSAEDIAQALCITGTAEECIKEVEAKVEAGARDIDFEWIAPDVNGVREQMRVAARGILPYFGR